MDVGGISSVGRVMMVLFDYLSPLGGVTLVMGGETSVL